MKEDGDLYVQSPGATGEPTQGQPPTKTGTDGSCWNTQQLQCWDETTGSTDNPSMALTSDRLTRVHWHRHKAEGIRCQWMDNTRHRHPRPIPTINKPPTHPHTRQGTTLKATTDIRPPQASRSITMWTPKKGHCTLIHMPHTYSILPGTDTPIEQPATAPRR